MTPLDRLIAAIAPGWAWKRRRARQVLAAPPQDRPERERGIIYRKVNGRVVQVAPEPRGRHLDTIGGRQLR